MGTTPNGLPYPEPTDPVAQGAAAIKALAEAVDPRVGARAIATGQATLTSITPNTLATLAVSFPAGRFTAAPLVFVSLNAANVHGCTPAAATAITASGFTLNGARTTGNANIPVSWLAIQ